MKASTVIPFLATAVAAKNLGCYSSLDLGDSANQSTYEFNSYGSCQAVCSVSAHKYTALQGDKCTCVEDLPPASALVDSDQCAEPCPGFASDICGGADGVAWTVLDTDPEKNHPSNFPATPSVTATGTVEPTNAANSTTTLASSSTVATTSIPTAAATAGSVYLGSVAAAMGMGVVANLL